MAKSILDKVRDILGGANQQPQAVPSFAPKQINTQTPRLPSFREVTNYFNPQSNAGRNFWSTPVARGLGSVQQNVIQPVINRSILNPQAPSNQLGSRLVGANPLLQALPGFTQGALPFLPKQTYQNIPQPIGAVGNVSRTVGQIAGSLAPFSLLSRIPAAVSAGTQAAKLAPAVSKVFPGLTKITPKALEEAGKFGVAGTLYSNLAKLPEKSPATIAKETPEELGLQAGLGLAFPLVGGVVGKVGGKVISKAKGGMDDLLREAKKYKSAEEFVRARVNMIHGTNADFREFKEVSPSKGQAIYLSRPDQLKAKSVASDKGRLMEVAVDESKVKTFDTQNPNAEQESIIQRVIDKIYGKGKYIFDYRAPIETRNIINRVDDALQSEVIKQGSKLGYNDFRFYEPSTNEYSRAITDNSLVKTRPQLTDIWNRATKAQALGQDDRGLGSKLTPDLREARKYKSAEDFVRTWGQKVYRGINESSGAKKKWSLQYFTYSPERAMDYGTEYIEKTVFPKKTADFTNPTEELKQILLKNEYGFGTTKIDKLLSHRGLNIGDNFFDLMEDRNIQAALQKAGYDSVKYPDVSNQFVPHDTFATLPNYKESVTKSQLTDIWNRANQQAQIGKVPTGKVVQRPDTTEPTRQEAFSIDPSRLKTQLVPESRGRQTSGGSIPQVDAAYLAEATPETLAKAQTKQEKFNASQSERDLKEWQEMVFKRAGAIFKTRGEALSQKISKGMGEATDARLKREFVTTQGGNIITSKGGKMLEKNIMDRATTWKDKPRLLYGRETMERNFEDIMGKDAPEMKARYIDPVKASEAQRQRFLTKERGEIKELGIAARSEQSKLVQQLGEGLISKEEILKRPDGEKIVKAEQVLREKYKKYLTDINAVLTRNGYDPIPERKDYFRHFTETQGLLEQVGIPLRDSSLPTDVNGISMDFKPGKNFFANALQRKTNITDYDAIQGIDGYLEGASKQLFHTDNIQNLRLFEKGIRETFAGTKHLTNFAADLSEYINNLAGKKSMADRAVENIIGRGAYAFSNTLRKQVGANMIGANVASNLTNFIPLTQALATTDKPSFARGMMSTITALLKDDGFRNRSDFLTRRVGSDPLSINLWNKIGRGGAWLMKAVDNFTSGTIVRGKYYEGIKQGLSPVQAMKRADDWAERIISGRSLGSMPTLFNSQMLGFITQFQLEVNNQLSFMFKDIPRNYNIPAAASALGQVFLYSYLFNNLYERAFGRRPAFDPIAVAQRGYEDYTNPDLKEGQATKNLVRNVGEQLPFTSTLTGGRIPLGAAVPDLPALIKGESTMKREFSKPLFHLLPPTGGGQLKKTLEGISAFDKGASTSESGRVRYVIPQTAENRIRTVIAGQYSTPEARTYFREGTAPLGELQSKVLLASPDKQAVYNEVTAGRARGAADNKSKEELKASGQKSLEKDNKVYIQDGENIKTIDLDFQPTPPKLTGNTELDKKSISEFNGEITKKANDIYALYQADKMTAEEANKALEELTKLKNKYKKKKFKKLTLGKVALPKTTLKLKFGKTALGSKRATKKKKITLRDLFSKDLKNTRKVVY